MSDEAIIDSGTTPRRQFLGTLAATAVGLSAAACAPAAAATTASPVRPTRQGPTEWDDSWTRRLGTTHRAVFDSPALSTSMASQLAGTMADFQTALGVKDSDLHFVLVIRHTGIPMAFNDHLWAKYEIGAALNVKDPLTGEPAKRNPYTKPSLTTSSAVDTLRDRGVLLLACNLAAMNSARNFAQKSGTPLATVQDEVRANMLPGVILQPNGIYAVLRAQDVGCALFKG